MTLIRTVVLSLAFCALATSASAQAALNKSLAWDQTGTTAVEAQAFTYKYYPDGAAVGVTLTGVTCTGTPVACSVPFPAFTPGSHALTLTATNTAGESPKSSPFAFVFVVVPGAPSNIRIQ